MVKRLLEELMREEGAICLEQHPTKANGYCISDLLTLAGSVEDLRVPRVRKGDFPQDTLLTAPYLFGAFGNHSPPL